MRQLAFIVFVSMALIGVAASAGAIPVTVTYTADNEIVGTWYHSEADGMVKVSNPIESDLDNDSWTNWQFASTATYELGPGAYEHVWQVKDTGGYAGFLAQIAFDDSLLLSSNTWEYSTYAWDGNSDTSFDDDFWNWSNVTEFGANGAWNLVWYGVNGGPISGIEGDAQWIWGGSQTLDGLFIKTTFEIAAAPVPEPATLLLLGAGLAGLAAVGRRKFSRKGPAEI